MHERDNPPGTRGRVRCLQVNRITGRTCGAERLLAVSDTCLVCGGAVHARVEPTVGDIPSLYADVARLIADLLQVDPSPEHRALEASLTTAMLAHELRAA